uniref:Uncharacterized protein n=1 Tax=Ixodes ricinus TaxID=34613 RepID=A0A147BS91_IXORI
MEKIKLRQKCAITMLIIFARLPSPAKAITQGQCAAILRFFVLFVFVMNVIGFGADSKPTRTISAVTLHFRNFLTGSMGL